MMGAMQKGEGSQNGAGLVLSWVQALPPQTKFLSRDAPKSTHSVTVLQNHCPDTHRERLATCVP